MRELSWTVLHLDDEWQHCDLCSLGVQLQLPSQLHQLCHVDIVVKVEVRHSAGCCHGTDHGTPVTPAQVNGWHLRRHCSLAKAAFVSCYLECSLTGQQNNPMSNNFYV